VNPTLATDPGVAWGVNFDGGVVNFGYKVNVLYVRGVRSGL
jgi:hypothetical protein